MKKRKHGFYQLIPEKLIEKLEEIQQYPPKIIGFRISYMKQIVHLICTKKRNDGYSHLKMSYLKELIPGAEQYVRYLLNQNIIERDGFYQPGNKCYGYKFSMKYNSKYQSYPLTDAKLLRRIERINVKANHAGYLSQNKWIRDLIIDPEAFSFAETIYTEIDSYNYAIASITQVLNNEKFYIVDSTSFRYHSNLTTMPKELRRFVVIYGKHLIGNVDIKNSQPYFSTILLTNPMKVADLAKDKDLRMKLKSLQVEQNDDVKLYINLVCSGQFYEYLMKEFEKRGLSYTRDQVKKAVMIILFDRNSHMSRPRKILAELFPTVLDIFHQLRGNKKGDKFEGYQRFAILLQSIEAHVVLKIILKKLNRDHPDIIALTVHDSILCTSDPEKVKERMTVELEKFVGRPPILKIENLQNGVKSHNKDNNGRNKVERIKKKEGVIELV
jgi:hypothetical protein